MVPGTTSFPVMAPGYHRGAGPLVAWVATPAGDDPAAGSKEDSMIEAHQLTKRYGDKTAVDRLDFAVKPGAVTVRW